MEDTEAWGKTPSMCFCIHIHHHHNTCTLLPVYQTPLHTLKTKHHHVHMRILEREEESAQKLRRGERLTSERYGPGLRGYRVLKNGNEQEH